MKAEKRNPALGASLPQTHHPLLRRTLREKNQLKSGNSFGLFLFSGTRSPPQRRQKEQANLWGEALARCSPLLFCGPTGRSGVSPLEPRVRPVAVPRCTSRWWKLRRAHAGKASVPVSPQWFCPGRSARFSGWLTGKALAGPHSWGEGDLCHISR